MFMERSLACALFAAILSCAPVGGGADEPLSGPIPATVVRVVDGDTVVVRARIWLGQEVTTHVRVARVDAPEIFRPGCEQERARGRAAHAFVEQLIAQTGSEVALSNVRYGKYAGRVVADLSLDDGRDVGAALIAAGLAVDEAGEEAWCPGPGRQRASR